MFCGLKLAPLGPVQRFGHLREAQQRATNMAVLQAEIGALQEKLTAARQVGKAAIAALHIGSAAPTKPEERRGWLGGFIGFLRRRSELLKRANESDPAI